MNDTSYRFTMDFNVIGGSKQNIAHIVNNFGIPNTIVEVGVFEGGTTFWMSDELTKHNEKLKIYAIDPHRDSVDLKDDLNEVHERFVHNLKVNSHKNIEYIRDYSENGLIDLINRGVKPELIYIDGDHRASEVLTDLVLSFKLLVPGGVILCDDATDWKYTDEHGVSATQMSPRMAIEMFVACNWNKITPIRMPDAGQTAFKKL